MAAVTCNSDFTNDLEDDVLGQQVGRQFTIQYKPDAGRHLDEQLACAQDEASVGVANARCKLTKGTSVTCVGVRAKHDLACKHGPGNIS